MSLEAIALLSEADRQAYADRLAAELMRPVPIYVWHHARDIKRAETRARTVASRQARLASITAIHVVPNRSSYDRARDRAADGF